MLKLTTALLTLLLCFATAYADEIDFNKYIEDPSTMMPQENNGVEPYKDKSPKDASAKDASPKDTHYYIAQAAMWTASAADLGYTWHKTKDPAFAEGSPILGHSRLRQGIIVGSVALGTSLGAHFVHRRGSKFPAGSRKYRAHNIAKKVLLWGNAAIHTVCLGISASVKKR